MKDINVIDVLQYLLFKEYISFSKYVQLVQLSEEEIKQEISRYK